MAPYGCGVLGEERCCERAEAMCGGDASITLAERLTPSTEVVARLRGTLSLREMMIHPVRTGYLGQQDPIDPKLLPPSAEKLFPNVAVTRAFAPSPDGPIRCEVFRPEGAPQNLPMMLYFHGGGFMVGRSEDTEFLTRKMCVQKRSGRG